MESAVATAIFVDGSVNLGSSSAWVRAAHRFSPSSTRRYGAHPFVSRRTKSCVVGRRKRAIVSISPRGGAGPALGYLAWGPPAKIRASRADRARGSAGTPPRNPRWSFIVNRRSRRSLAPVHRLMAAERIVDVCPAEVGCVLDRTEASLDACLGALLGEDWSSIPGGSRSLRSETMKIDDRLGRAKTTLFNLLRGRTRHVALRQRSRTPRSGAVGSARRRSPRCSSRRRRRRDVRGVIAGSQGDRSDSNQEFRGRRRAPHSGAFRYPDSPRRSTTRRRRSGSEHPRDLGRERRLGGWRPRSRSAGPTSSEGARNPEAAQGRAGAERASGSSRSPPTRPRSSADSPSCPRSRSCTA